MLQHRHFVVMLYHSKNFRELWKHSKMLDHRHSLTEGATEMFSLNKESFTFNDTQIIVNTQINILKGVLERKISKVANKGI